MEEVQVAFDSFGHKTGGKSFLPLNMAQSGRIRGFCTGFITVWNTGADARIQRNESNETVRLSPLNEKLNIVLRLM